MNDSISRGGGVLVNPIRSARKAKGLSRKQLSAMTGIHDRQLSDYERGRYRPTGERLSALAEVLDVNPELIGSTDRRRKHHIIRDIPAEEREQEILELETLARNIIRWNAAAVRASGVDQEDLLQDLMVGAIMAVDAFDPAVGSNLAGYAYRTMTFHLYRSVRRSSTKGMTGVPPGINPRICSVDVLAESGFQLTG